MKQNSQLNLNSVLNYLTDMIILCSAEFEIIECNTAANIILKGGESIVGEKCHALLHHKKEPCFDCPLEATIRSGRLKHLNYFNDSIDEYFEERTHPIMDGKSLDGFILMCRNVTEIREIEDKFAQAKKMAAIGQISSGVAHDFNNVITGILGRIRMMRKTFSGAAFDEHFDLLEKNAQAGAETVRRMQEFTRASKQTSYVEISLTDLIDEVIALTRPKWHEATKSEGRLVKVISDIEDNIYIKGNTSELHNAFTNLIFNAVDAMPDGGFISFKCQQQDNQVLLRVQDTGTGMTDEIIQKIFDPFFTTKGSEGNGLGMSEVYGVIKRHSGTIEVQSEVGEGTTFILTFPVHVPEKAPEDEVLPEVGTLRVLAIDDQEFILETLQDVLNEIGHETSCFVSPRAAIRDFKSNQYDAIIVDLEMPEMNGQAFAEEIKTLDPAMPIILLSGWFIDLKEEKSLAKVIDFTLAKPFTVKDIQKVLAKAIGLKKTEAVQD